MQVTHEGLKSMVVYWHPDCFLDERPYRKIVRWMIGVWRQKFDVFVRDEPAEEKHEDFIVHKLSLSDRPLQVYWEDSLGYVAIQGKDEALVFEAARLLKGMKPALK